MIRKTVLALAAGVAIALTAQAQVYNWADGEEPDEPLELENLHGFVVGLNIGFYQANSNTASIYNGYGFDREGERNTFANSWLNRYLNQSPQRRAQIGETMNIGPQEWSFDESDMPNEMTFRPAFMWGAHFRYHLNPDFAFFAEVGGANPVTVGEFTITNNTAAPGQLQAERINRFQIRGEEQRLLLTLGMRQVIGRKERERQGKSVGFLPLIEFGLNSTFVSFEESFISMPPPIGTGDLTVFFTPQGFQTEEARNLTGIGFGAFGGLGGQIFLGGHIMVDLVYRPSFEHVRLGAWDERSFQHQLLVRAVWTQW